MSDYDGTDPVMIPPPNRAELLAMRLEVAAQTLEGVLDRLELMADQAQADTVEDAIDRGVEDERFPRCPYVDDRGVRCSAHFAHDGMHVLEVRR